MNSARIFLDRGINNWIEHFDPDEHQYLKNGLIKESSFDEAVEQRTMREKEEFEKEGEEKHFVDASEFKEFMIQVGIMRRCIWAWDSKKNDSIFIQEDDERQNELKNCTSYLFNPSLSNAPIAEAYGNRADHHILYGVM